MHSLNGREGKEVTEIRADSKRQRRGQTELKFCGTKTGVNSYRKIH